MNQDAAGSPAVGLLIVDKAEGPTSHDVVSAARRALGIRRIGHTGTLDPMATGVLVLMLGGATRLAPQMTGHRKLYAGEGRLGWATDTYDRTGQPLGPEAHQVVLDSLRLAEAAADLTGEILQAPPPYSARKVDGVRLYRHARRGNQVEGRTVKIQVVRFAVRATSHNRFQFTAEVSTGTYIRALVHDLGQKLGYGAHLTALRRLQTGPFLLEDALPQKDLAGLRSQGLRSPYFVPFHRIPLALPVIRVSPADQDNLRHGRPARPNPGPDPGTGLMQARDHDDRLIALVGPDPENPGHIVPQRVFAPPPGVLTPPVPNASVSPIPRDEKKRIR